MRNVCNSVTGDTQAREEAQSAGNLFVEKLWMAEETFSRTKHSMLACKQVYLKKW